MFFNLCFSNHMTPAIHLGVIISSSMELHTNANCVVSEAFSIIKQGLFDNFGKRP